MLKKSRWVLAFCVAGWDNVAMRGTVDAQTAMLSTLSTEDLIGGDHPIRRIRAVVDAVLEGLDGELGAMYPARGRPSVPPEMLLKASVLMALYSIRSERAFCERLNFDMLFKWFLGLRIDERGFDASTFSKNRQRLLDHEIADRFFAAVVDAAKLRRYCSSGHFSVDGTLLEAWASHKSFKPRTAPEGPQSPQRQSPQPQSPQRQSPQPQSPQRQSPQPAAAARGRNPETDWRGARRRNDTHASVTDPEARLFRKSAGTAAALCFMGHLLTENRNGLIVDADLTAADGYAERGAAAQMLNRAPPRARRRTVGADRNYDTKDFVADARGAGFTPHVAQNTTRRRSAIDRRTTRHIGYTISQQARKRVEEPFGWIKTIAGGRKLRYRGRQRNRAWFLTAAASYNLVRIARLDTRTA